ncbi:MAG TPA: prepilin-type N-terminal cleavage/methylation domain-containing protein [Planctomycetota bacterium]|nr:prepilin-type N-terminal cleavage/methylation domain-containing protein [Planctomycetota bacterium]
MMGGCRVPGAAPGGFTMVEVMIALALIAIGVLIGLTMITTSSMQNEISKEQAIGYRACQDVMEALMTMDQPTLLAQMAASPATFTVPPLNPATPPTGSYTITDITTTVNPSATSTELVQIQIRLLYKNVNVTLTSLRHLP